MKNFSAGYSFFVKKSVWLIAAGLVFSQATLAQQNKIDVARRLLEYDQKLPLDIKEESSFERPGARVHEMTFASPKGGRVTASLVVPTQEGPHAGIVFGHWGNGNRTEFLPEAILLAEAGAASIIIDYPWERTAPWWKKMPGVTEPEKQVELFIQAIVDLRRALDVLLARRDVDHQRIAYVGHSFGAQWGAILAALDQRMKTAVLMAGVPSAASLWLESTGDAGVVEYRKSLPKEKLQNFVELYSQLDAIDFVPHAKPISLLFQFARQERIMAEEHMRQYAQAASEPKTVLWYDAGHELADMQTMIDRADWLEKQIGLKPIKPILQKKLK